MQDTVQNISLFSLLQNCKSLSIMAVAIAQLPLQFSCCSSLVSALAQLLLQPSSCSSKAAALGLLLLQHSCCSSISAALAQHCCKSYQGEVIRLIFHHSSNLLKIEVYGDFHLQKTCNKTQNEYLTLSGVLVIWNHPKLFKKREKNPKKSRRIFSKLKFNWVIDMQVFQKC